MKLRALVILFFIGMVLIVFMSKSDDENFPEEESSSLVKHRSQRNSGSSSYSSSQTYSTSGRERVSNGDTKNEREEKSLSLNQSVGSFTTESANSFGQSEADLDDADSLELYRVEVNQLLAEVTLDVVEQENFDAFLEKMQGDGEELLAENLIAARLFLKSKL